MQEEELEEEEKEEEEEEELEGLPKATSPLPTLLILNHQSLYSSTF